MAIINGTCTGTYASHYAVWIDYTIGSYSIANNTTPVNVKEYLQSDSSSYGAYNLSTSNYAYTKYDNANELGVYRAIDTRNQALVLLKESNYTISHAADGTKTVTLQAGFTISGTTSLTGGSVSGSVTLPTIPRYTTINSFNVSKDSGTDGLTQLACAWSTTDTCSQIAWKQTGGSWNYINVSSTTGSFDITGLSPGTTYSIELAVKRSDSGLWTYSSAVSQTTYTIGTLSSGTNFDDDENPVLTYTNASGAVLNARLEFDSVSIQRDTITSSPYTFSLSSAERTTLLSHTTTSNTMTVREVIATEVGGTETYWSYIDYTMTVVDGEPTFTTFTIADTNVTTLALTDDDTKVIKDYSDMSAIITTGDKAVANKGATMVDYELTIGSESNTENYSADSTVNIDILDAISNVATVRAIDSRGNYTDVEISGTSLIEYIIPVVLTARGVRTGDVGEETTLSYTGTWWGNSFGTVTNDLIITYKYKKTSEPTTWTDGTTDISPTTDTTTFSFEDTIIGDTATGFDASFSYNIQLTITDELETITKSFILESGSPSIAIHADGLAVKQAYDDTKGSGLQVAGKIYLNGAEFTGGSISSMTLAEYTALEDKSGTIITTDEPDTSITVINDLTSTSTVNALSANQGKVLNDKFSGVVLYNNTTGTNGAITLSETAANFTYMEFYYKNGYGNYSSTKAFSPDGKTILLNLTGQYIHDSVYNMNRAVNISGTALTNNTNWYGTMIINAGTPNLAYDETLITIVRIVGYR